MMMPCHAMPFQQIKSEFEDGNGSRKEGKKEKKGLS